MALLDGILEWKIYMLHTVMCNLCTVNEISEPEWLNIIQMHIFIYLLFTLIFKESTPVLCLTLLVGNTLVHNNEQLPETQWALNINIKMKILLDDFFLTPEVGSL